MMPCATTSVMSEISDSSFLICPASAAGLRSQRISLAWNCSTVVSDNCSVRIESSNARSMKSLRNVRPFLQTRPSSNPEHARVPEHADRQRT